MKPFPQSVKLQITDDSGIITVINPDKYNSTLSYRKIWTNRDLREFLFETNKGSLIIWGTGMQAAWTVEIGGNASNRSVFREFTQTIEVSRGRLVLASFSDIMKTLQFEDDKIPSTDNEKLIIPLESGLYRMTVKQLFNPKDYDYDPEGKVNFELSFVPVKEILPDENLQIVWQEEDFGKDADIFLSNERNEFDDFLDQLVAKAKSEKGKSDQKEP